MLGMTDYNYEHFSREQLREWRRDSFAGPAPGEEAPGFKATALEGNSLRLSDFRGKKNVLLLFGSATCPMTATSLGAVNELYDRLRGEDVEFIFVYVREAHPGERIPAHESTSDKVAAAWLLRKEEQLEMPVVVDDLRGSIHRKYGKLPNPAFLIDKSGRVAFRSMWTNPEELSAAFEELLELEQEREIDHAVVRGGEDLSMPLSYSSLNSYRALERGGKDSIRDFQVAVGFPTRDRRTASALADGLLEHPGRVLAVIALSGAVLAGGLYAGFELRRRRLGTRKNPYRAYEKEKVRDTETGTDYGAVGI
jgi:alkyl hydroperoxide reductase subunit AhpC